MDTIAHRWKTLSGMNNWEGLLDPLDLDLRKYLIHYGEMSQATYDTFNTTEQSKYAGSSHYAKKNLFTKVGLQKGNKFKYQVTKYFYATSSIPVPDAFILKSRAKDSFCKQSNWIGFVAVATDEGKEELGRRDLVVAWRGTVKNLEWIDDFQFFLVPAPLVFGDDNNDVMIHQGWYSMYTSENARSHFNVTSARIQVIEEVKRLVEQYKNEEISITLTGHSMGGAMAILTATDIVANGFNKPEGNIQAKGCLVTVLGFGCPRLGNPSFATLISKLENIRVLRIQNLYDIVTKVPIVGYQDVGLELPINTTDSFYLKSPGDLGSWHLMEAYLHGIAGTQGSKGGFRLEVNRDIALVNKQDDCLKDEYLVPANWWVERNTGMVQKEDGSWMLMDHEHDPS